MLTFDSLISSMFKAKGLNVESPEVQSTIRNRVEKLIKSADSNSDNRLTREEILGACAKDPQLLAFF